ncbi:hypothetical protein [Thiosulfatimonas sediminis]
MPNSWRPWLNRPVLWQQVLNKMKNKFKFSESRLNWRS